MTIELTPQERAQANQASQLWAQGGTPTDPVLAQKFPGPQYGFGGLRCATDNLNGDNVEYIFFPTGVQHVFCYGAVCHAAADERDDHDPKAGHRRAGRRQSSFPVHWEHLV